MATTARESNNITTNDKEKKVISSSNSHGHSSGSSTRTSSTRASYQNKSPTNNNNGKSVPNYIKPTLRSRHESFKYVIKKNNNSSNEEATKPSLLRRRSFERPQSVSSTSPSSRVHKALISPRPRERSSRTLAFRSASFSSSKINSSPKPIVERISKTPKGTKSTMTTPPTSFSKNNVKKTSVNIPSKKEPLRKSASASSSKVSTPHPERPNHNDQEHKREDEQVVLEHHNEEKTNNVEEVVEVGPSELPNPVVDTEQVLFNGGKEDEKKLDVIASSEEQQEMSKINQLPTQTHEEDGGGQCDEEDTCKNNNQDQTVESGNLTLRSDETTKQPESSREEYDDETKVINNPTDDHESPTKEETVDAENKFAEEVKEEVNDIEEEVKLPNIVVPPTKPQGGSNHGRKESSPAYNDVIEETASKLLEKRKNKVKALVGAFETVIDYESSSK